jgi:hypothetical protein
MAETCCKVNNSINLLILYRNFVDGNIINGNESFGSIFFFLFITLQFTIYSGSIE